MEDDPPNQCSIARIDSRASVSDEAVKRAVLATLKRHNATRAVLSIALVDDAHIARLHHEHLGTPEPTDVITFDLRDSGSTGTLEGEIVVSVETAEREAHRRSNSLEAETLLYIVHGCLHLLGYDDKNADDARRMHGVEDELLAQLGFGAVFASRQS